MRHASICIRPCLAFLHAQNGLTRAELAIAMNRSSRHVGGMIEDLKAKAIIIRAGYRLRSPGWPVIVWSLTPKGRKIALAFQENKLAQMNGQRSLKAKPRSRRS